MFVYIFNMQNVFIISTCVVIFYAILKFIEVKYIQKEEEYNKGIKEYVRDGIIIYLSTILSAYFYFTFEKTILEFFNVVTDNKNVIMEKVEVFTDSPNF